MSVLIFVSFHQGKERVKKIVLQHSLTLQKIPFMKLHVNVEITGRVQGVWFRKNTCEQAEKFGITGFVQNQANGSVYIEAEGEEEPLEAFLQWCRVGPPLAKVKEFIVMQSEDLQHFQDFELRRPLIDF